MKRFISVFVVLNLAVMTWSWVAHGDPGFFHTVTARNAIINHGTLTQEGTSDFQSTFTLTSGAYIATPTVLAITNDSLTLPAAAHVQLAGDSLDLVFLTAGTTNQVVWITCDDTTEIVFKDGSNLDLSGDANVDSNDVIILMYIDDAWQEVVHTAN